MVFTHSFHPPSLVFRIFPGDDALFSVQLSVPPPLYPLMGVWGAMGHSSIPSWGFHIRILGLACVFICLCSAVLLDITCAYVFCRTLSSLECDEQLSVWWAKLWRITRFTSFILGRSPKIMPPARCDAHCGVRVPTVFCTNRVDVAKHLQPLHAAAGCCSGFWGLHVGFLKHATALDFESEHDR